METKNCPNCSALVPSLSNICEYCGATLENRHHTPSESTGKPTLDQSIKILEEDIIKLKSVPVPSIGKNVKTALFAYLTLGLYLLFRNIFRKKVLKENSFEALEAIAVKNSRNIRTYYGDDSRVRSLILELDDEIKSIKDLHKKKKKTTNVGCLSIFVIVCGGYVLSTLFFVLNEDERNQKRADKEHENALIYSKIDSLIELNQYSKAKSLTVSLHWYGEDIKALKKIQQSKIEKQLKDVKQLIIENKLNEAELALIDIKWVPIDVKKYGDYSISTEDKEMIRITEEKRQSLLNIIKK